MREKAVWSSVNDPAEGLALTTAIRGDKESTEKEIRSL